MQLEQLGPYRIGRKLGRGGMGTVYEGVEIESGSEVAVKVLAPAMSADEGFRERFESEIDTLKKLEHPNIVRLYGYGEQDGLLFYSMELVRGTNLEDELAASRPFDWREVTHIGVRLAKALKHAHDHGVIHRDIKPANLLLDEHDEVKLTDFGIAKLFGNTSLTADGGVIGTAEYMSPEQADGSRVTYRSDLYSLGGVMYALVARRPPFRAKSIVEMLQLQRFAQPEPIQRFNADIPAELASIITQLLEKEPEKRIHNAMILARRLEAMEHALSIRGRPAELKQTLGDEVPANPQPPISGEVDAYSVTKGDSDASASKHVSLEHGPAPGVGETQLTGSDEQAALSISMAEPPPQPAAARFTTVEEDRQQSRREERAYRETLRELVSPQTWLLVGALVIVGLTAYYLMQPPAADTLYARIERLADQENPDALLDAEDDIELFLTHYSGPQHDQQVRQLEAYRHRIERMKLERQYERRARRRDDVQDLTPAEVAYAEVMEVARLDPVEGVARLEALLELYDDDQTAALTDDTSLCLQLARSKLIQLRQQSDHFVRQNLAALNEQLQRAERAEADNPEVAQAIRQSIVLLYQHKPWAAEVVEQAKAKLAK